MNFSDLDISVIAEIGNVSVGGAASSLSDFMNMQVSISSPETKIMTFEDIKKRFEPAVVFAKIGYTEGFQGSNVMLMKSDEAFQFSQIIVKEKIDEDILEWDDMAKDALSEMFNIMIGSMSSSLSDLFKREIDIETPKIYEEEAEKLNFYEDEEVLITVWFDIKLEERFKFKMVQIITDSQAESMVKMMYDKYMGEGDL